MEWSKLTELTQGKPFTVERVRMADNDVAIEGRFEPPPLAALSMDDQVFVAAFVRSHGSIKQMEKLFGVSYPTIKNRLNRIGGQLPFVNVDVEPGQTDVLDRLDRGEISVEDALEALES
ncbi:MAG: DUF2089 domain-containing protein [bacterium]|nr:DUF2089 domain-containing protein [bacterium]